MSPARRSRLVIIILPVLAFLCVGVLIAGAAIAGLPDRAAAVFGPPRPTLSGVDRIRLATLLLWQQEDLTTPADPTGDPRAFTVQIGESLPSILDRLWRAGLIANPGATRSYLQYAGLDTTLQAGEYRLSPAMTPIEIAHALQDATPRVVQLAILPGWRAEEIAESLIASGLNLTMEEVLEAVRDPYLYPSLQSVLPAGGTWEGFLFPDRYELGRDAAAEEVVRSLVDNFNNQVGSDLRAGIGRQGLSLYEGVTLASIVEREAVITEEAPLIASVFLNRLEAGMKLDADPTVQYAVGYNAAQRSWWTNPLSLADLEIESPYNTYRSGGLPPGPISNPGLGALRAVAFPAQAPYYYFRAACTESGRHVFAETLEEHVQNACP